MEQNKSLGSFPPCFSQSPLLTDFTPPPLSISSLKLVYNVNIVYRNLKSENSQDYAQKPQRNYKFMNSASVLAGLLKFEAFVIEATYDGFWCKYVSWKERVEKKERGPFLLYNPLCSMPSLFLWSHDINWSSFYPY